MNSIEPLESRTLLSAGPLPRAVEPGSSMSTALDLGTLSGIRSVAQSLSPADRADYYRLSVRNRGNVNIAITGQGGSASVDLRNSRGGAIASDAVPGKASHRISLLLNAGTYYVRVYQSNVAISLPYTLRLQADLNWGTVSVGGKRKPVGLLLANGSTRAISSSRDTWIVIHGWLSDPSGITTTRLATAIQHAAPSAQVLVLDWSKEANQPLLDAADWVPAVAKFASSALARWHIGSSRINIVGHSLGGYVSAELASDVSGGVNRLIGLDPATLFPATFLDPVDFSADSRFSLVMIGSAYSTPESAATATEAFRVNVGDYNSIITHANVADLFASMVEANASSKPDNISRLFAFNKLAPGVAQPWKANAYSGGFEGTITGQVSGFAWVPKTLVYISRTTGRRVTVTA